MPLGTGEDCNYGGSLILANTVVLIRSSYVKYSLSQERLVMIKLHFMGEGGRGGEGEGGV